MREETKMAGAGEAERRIETMPPRSVVFYAAIVVVPVGLVMPWLAPGRWVTWVVAAGAAWVLLECVRLARVRFSWTVSGVVRRGLGGCRRMRWEEVEAIGMRAIGGRVDSGHLFLLYGRKGVMRMAISDMGVAAVIERFKERCPRALVMDEDEGTFIVQKGMDAERARELVAMHARRMRWMHGWIVMGVIAGAAAVVILRGTMGDSDWRVAAVAGGAVVILCWRSVKALWR